MAAYVNRSVDACSRQAWHLHVWHPDDPVGTSAHVPWQCRSWRHPGECRLWRGAQDFVRCREAIASRDDWVYLVLTFRQLDWPCKWRLYREGVVMWSKLRKRFCRRYGRVEYIQTWEKHAKGGAHVNVLVGNRSVSRAVREDWRGWRRKWLEPAAVDCGFGPRTWVEGYYGNPAALAGYLGKLSRELVGAGNKNQIPEDAPRHFRRLRASQGLLPPPYKGEYTGRLVQCELNSWLEATEGKVASKVDFANIGCRILEKKDKRHARMESRIVAR